MWNNRIHNRNDDASSGMFSTEPGTSYGSMSGTFGSTHDNSLSVGQFPVDPPSKRPAYSSLRVSKIDEAVIPLKPEPERALSFSTHSEQSGRRSTSFSSRRISKIDDTAIPLEPERERSTRQRVSGRLSCANLRFSNLSVVGREDEVATLRTAFNRARGRFSITGIDEILGSTEDHKLGSKELVLISGVSGQGKSRLASTVAERVNKSGGLFVQGKYDLFFRDEPYFGISLACGEICGHILQLKEDKNQGDAEKFDKICLALQHEIGDEFHLLANVFPPIVEIVGEYNDRASEIVHQRSRSEGKTTDVNLEQSREQFNYLFRKFIRIVTADKSIFGTPLVMVLDDLQWADMASLELMKLLLTDRDSSGLMIVGCYRSEEVTETHSLSKAICDLRDGMQSRPLSTISEITLDELSPMDVNNILMELLSIDDHDKTMPLAELCHKRSMGNPFHLMTFLRMLQEERFLEFNLGTFRWMFDIEKIEKKTSATTNVVDMVTASLQQAPLDLQRVLHVAACLGSTFEFHTLYLVWNELRSGEETESQLSNYIEEAVRGYILEVECDSKRYRWAHDQVQEAAMILGKAHSDDMQFQVGLLLLKKFQQSDLDVSIIFVIANLLMCGSSKHLSSIGKKKREEIVKINLESAKRAVASSAFKSAAKYVKSASALIGDDAFKENYDLMLELCSLGAEVEGCIGNDDEMQVYYDMVSRHGTEPLHKIRCYQAQLLRLSNTKRTKAACMLCIDILDELGSCKIPRNSTYQVIKAMLALQKVKDVQQEILHGLPTVTDPTELATMSILNSLTTCANLCGNSFLLILVSCTMYQRTMKYGLCPSSTSAFATIAMVRIAMGNFQGGSLFSDHAISLLPIFDSKSELSRINFISYFMVKVWTIPFLSCLKPLRVGYQAGLECGDTESSCWNIMMYISIRGFSGANLESILADLRTYLPQMEDLGQEEQSLQIKIFYQACLCFVGLSSNPTEMSGKVIPNAEEFEKELQSLESKLAFAIFKVHQSWLYSIFGEHERGAELALERGNGFFKLSSGAPPAMLDTFHRGISLFDMAKRTKKSKYKRAAKNVLSTMKGWAKSGNPNVVHSTSILEAECFFCWRQSRHLNHLLIIIAYSEISIIEFLLFIRSSCF